MSVHDRSILDDPDHLAQTDPSDFLGSVERFPEQVRQAWRLGVEAGDLPSGEGVVSLAILGVGGSGISGDATRGVLGARSVLPVHTLRGSELPAWVGRNTLVFAVSYSGNTEETLHLFDEARERGARLVALTSGGALEGRARAAGATLVKLPNSLQPRAALGYLTIPILLICERLGLGPEIARSMPAALEQLERRAVEYGRSSPSPQNDAKRLALSLSGRLPWVYGSEGMSEVAAYRWKCQMNECAKVPCSSSFFPELTHNEVVGWSGLPALTRKHAALIVLRHNGETVSMARRMDATVRMIRSSFGFYAEIRAEGPSDLARFLDLTYLGDFTSTYLGIAGGVDPAPVEPIDRLKEELKTPQRILLDGGVGPGPSNGIPGVPGPADLDDEIVRVLDAGSI